MYISADLNISEAVQYQWCYKTVIDLFISQIQRKGMDLWHL